MREEFYEYSLKIRKQFLSLKCLISEERKNRKFGKKFELRVRGGIVA